MQLYLAAYVHKDTLKKKKEKGLSLFFTNLTQANLEGCKNPLLKSLQPQKEIQPNDASYLYFTNTPPKLVNLNAF